MLLSKATHNLDITIHLELKMKQKYHIVYVHFNISRYDDENIEIKASAAFRWFDIVHLKQSVT